MEAGPHLSLKGHCGKGFSQVHSYHFSSLKENISVHIIWQSNDQRAEGQEQILVEDLAINLF